MKECKSQRILGFLITLLIIVVGHTTADMTTVILGYSGASFFHILSEYCK